MNPQEFANTIRQKYPGSYDHVDDQILTQKVIEKYPVYADKVDFGQGSETSPQLSTEVPPLDTGLRTMTGSFNPNPPNILPSYVGNIPYTTGQEAGNFLEERTAEKIGAMGYPKTGAAIGTGMELLHTGAQAMMMPDLPIPKMFSRGAAKAGKLFAGGIEKVTGIPTENTISAFTKPLSMFKAPTQKTVSEAYAKSEIPESVSGLKGIIEEGSSGTARFVRRGSQALEDFVQNGVQDAEALLKGRQALDQEIALLENQMRIGKRGTMSSLQNKIDAKNALRQSFNRALDQMAPQHRAADAMASERFKVAPFRDLTLPGKINLFSPEGISRAVPGLPTAVGLGASGAGATSELASQVIQKSPKIATVLAAPHGKYVRQNGKTYKWNGSEYIEVAQ